MKEAKIKVEKIKVDITLPHIAFCFNHIEYKLASFTVEGTPSTITSKAALPIQQFITQIVEMLNYIPAEISANGEAKEVTFKSRRTRYGDYVSGIEIENNVNLQNVLGSPSVRFGSRSHTALTQVAYNYNVSLRLLETLIVYGLAGCPVSKVPYLTQEGITTLDSLRQQLNEKRSIKLAHRLLKYYSTPSSSEIKPDYLTDLAIYNELAYIVTKGAYTGILLKTYPKGIEFIRKYSTQLVGMKKTTVAMLVKLISLLPLEALPQFLSHNHPDMRTIAKQRIDELQKR